MKKIWILLALAGLLAGHLAAQLPSQLPSQPGFDFKQLDKLGANAKDATSVTLEGPTLKLAASFLGSDADDKDAAALKSLVARLKGIYVRSWEFDKAGMYNAADIEPFRAYVRGQQWSRIVEVKEADESSEVYLKTGTADKFGGVAIISAEPRELTIVYIEGTISIDDVAKLSGNLDIPDLDVLKHGTSKEGKSNANGKKDE